MAKTNDRPDLELMPYPWPVKRALLYLMELPDTATEEQYQARWMEIFHPIRMKGGKFNNQLLEKHIREIMGEEKCDWTKAANLAVQTAKGRQLMAAAN